MGVREGGLTDPGACRCCRRVTRVPRESKGKENERHGTVRVLDGRVGNEIDLAPAGQGSVEADDVSIRANQRHG